MQSKQSLDQVLNLIKDKEIRFVDFRFTDTKGKQHHVSKPSSGVDAETLEDGIMFDGSSIAGWKGINESDMVLMPDLDTAVIDPFTEESTLIITCDILEPATLQGYDRDPRSVARRALNYLQSSGVGDTAYFGPEPEFFVFESVNWRTQMGSSFYEIHTREAAWSSEIDYPDGNNGHRPRLKGGYFPVQPVDSLNDLRAAICLALEDMGQEVEVHHHEVANAGQCEIGVKFNTLIAKADEVQTLKYCVHNVAEAYGKTATFMPKPLVGDNGSGMHVHQSIIKDGENLFAGSGYGGLSDTALYYIGGVIKHARAINAFSNPSTNSYRRLVPGFEAPELLAYSARNRSAAIRIPHVTNPKARRVEVRFPDPMANPYLTFAALLMAGLDGILNKIHPGEAMDKDLYDLPAEEKANIPTVASSLDIALDALAKDHEFLLQGGVFTKDLIDAYIGLKMQEVTELRLQTHPVEFELYYSL